QSAMRGLPIWTREVPGLHRQLFFGNAYPDAVQRGGHDDLTAQTAGGRAFRDDFQQRVFGWAGGLELVEPLRAHVHMAGAADRATAAFRDDAFEAVAPRGLHQRPVIWYVGGVLGAIWQFKYRYGHDA